MLLHGTASVKGSLGRFLTHFCSLPVLVIGGSEESVDLIFLL